MRSFPLQHACLCMWYLRPTTSSNLLLHCPQDLDSHTSQMSRLHICNSKLARSMVNVITLFVILRFEFHNEHVEKSRREEKNWKDVWLLSKSMSFNSPPILFEGKGIHKHLAAIVGSKMTNHNIIDVLKKRLQTTVPLTTFAPIHRERVNLIVMTPVSFKPLFRPAAAGAGRARDGMNPQQSEGGGEKNNKKSRYYVSILGLRGVSELPWIAILRSFIPI